MAKKIIYTDLDGTLLDHNTYSFNDAKPALSLIKEKKIPLIFCTSKTRAEIEYWQKKIGIKHPFISENGGGIFIPKKYFSFIFNYTKEDDKYFIVNYGKNIEFLKKVINDLKKKYDIISLLDMNTKELIDFTGLSSDQIKLSKKREFTLPFILKNPKDEKKVLAEIKKIGMNVTIGGRFYHLMGNNNKGQAVCFLTNLFKKEFTFVYTIGLGDSINDFSMLESVDKGFLVRKKNNDYATNLFFHADGEGPKGWNKAVKKELE